MVKLALLVRLGAKPGKESAVEDFLHSGLTIVQDEPATTTGYAITWAIDLRHLRYLRGRIGKASAPHRQSRSGADGKSSRAFREGPSVIEKVDVLAAKLPGQGNDAQPFQPDPARAL